MRIVLLSNQSFLINEIQNSTHYSNIDTVDNFSSLYNILEDDMTIIYHLDSDENFENNLKEILKEYNKLKIIAIRNNTNNIEGCTLLKKGIKAYCHSMCPTEQFESIISSVNNGNIWMYPELMQFLISTVSLNQTKQESILEKISIKELEVLELVAEGHSNSLIAKTLNLAEVTVKKHISSLFKKLEQKDRLSLALYYKNNS